MRVPFVLDMGMLRECDGDGNYVRSVLLKAESHNIPSGYKLYTKPIPAEILNIMKERDGIRSKDPTSPVLLRLNNDINSATWNHRQKKL